MLSSLLLETIQNRAEVVRQYKIKNVFDFLQKARMFNIAFSLQYLQKDVIFQSEADVTKKLILRTRKTIHDNDAMNQPEYALQAADTCSAICILPSDVTACILLLMHLGYHSVAKQERTLRRTTKPIRVHRLNDCSIQDPCEMSIYVDITNQDQPFVELSLVLPESASESANEILNNFAAFLELQSDEKM